jgi:hypothetical protein
MKDQSHLAAIRKRDAAYKLERWSNGKAHLVALTAFRAVKHVIAATLTKPKGSIMSANNIAERQRQADKLHHEERIAWLSDERPKYADGSPVPEHEILMLLSGSKECLRLINDHGMYTNSANRVPARNEASPSKP